MAPTASNPTPKTVFIVGAGASQEVNMPVGSKLKDLICDVLEIQRHPYGDFERGDTCITQAFEKVPGPRNLPPYLDAAGRIRDAMPLAISIDHFLDQHSEDKHIELCGKLAIARTILQAEAESSLFFDLRHNSTMDFLKIQGTWFASFFHRLTENCSFANLATRLKSVVFIIFNYDRCVEHYLYHAIQKNYGKQASEVVPLLQGLEIYHPYGTVGTLPWCGGENLIAFGGNPSSTQFLKLADQIKTFSEVTDESSKDVNSIRSIVHTSHKLVFLGFAYHSMNMNLLFENSTSPKRSDKQRVFGTAYGLSNSDTQNITWEMENRWKVVQHNIHLHNGRKCHELFHEHNRGLSFT